MNTGTSQRIIVQRDTAAWKLQTWLSFGIACIAAGMGIVRLPRESTDWVFMFMGYFFCAVAIFTLSKHVRDRVHRQEGTPAFAAVAWGGFAGALALTAWGIWHMDISEVYKGYLTVSWLFLVTSAFTLAKMLRDEYEAKRSEEGTGAAGIEFDPGH